MKLLLTTVCRPIGPSQGDAPSVGYELLYGQVTRAQGIFSPRATHVHFSLNYIAQNVDTPTTVLQYPSKRQLVQELKKGYEYVGIPFILSTFHHMKAVVALVREHSPKSKIVLGGYGTVLGDAELKPYGDYICREEGVVFMRRLLGEPERPMPYEHPMIVSKLKVFSVPVSRTGMVFAGLGCANGCDFCSTSHFFKRRHIRLLPTGRDIFNVLTKYQDSDPGIQFTVLDEDFLLNKERAMEFRRLALESGKTFSIFAFASVRALSQYTTDELTEMGIDGVWIGYEGTRSGYGKQQGRPMDELFADLRRHGIQVLASMIVGFDYQDPDIIRREHQGLLRLRPAFCQFLIYGPTPGTPFYERVTAEGRMRSDLFSDKDRYYRNCTGFTAMVTHPTMSAEQIEGMQKWCFERDFQRLGPSILRSIRVGLSGYEHLSRSANPALRRKGLLFGREARRAYRVFLASKLFAPNARIRKWTAALERRAYRDLGAPTLTERLWSIAAVGAALWTRFTLCFDWFQHPRIPAQRYRWEPGRLMRLWGEVRQGGMLAELRVRLEPKAADGWSWMRLEGHLDGKNAEELSRRLSGILARGRDRLVINLEKLEWMDKKGLIAFHRAVRNCQGRVRIVMPKGQALPEVSAQESAA